MAGENETLSGALGRINGFLDQLSKSLHFFGQAFAEFERKIKATNDSNSAKFDKFLNKLKTHVDEIGQERRAVNSTHEQCLSSFQNQDRMKHSLVRLREELRRGEMSEQDCKDQEEKCRELAAFLGEAKLAYRESVGRYNSKMHQLFNDLKPFFNTMNSLDHAKDCLIVVMAQCLEDAGGLGWKAWQDSDQTELARSLDTSVEAETQKDFTGFQERLRINEKVLKYVENFSEIKVPSDPWRNHDSPIDGRASVPTGDSFYEISESFEIAEEDRDMLNILLSHFFSQSPTDSAPLQIYSVVFEQLFRRNANNEKFLKKLSRKVRAKRLELTSERFSELRQVVRLVLQSELNKPKRPPTLG